MVADFSDDGIGSEAAVVEFERGTSGTDVTAKKPDELVGLIGRGRNDMAIEIFLLFILRVLEFGAKFFVGPTRKGCVFEKNMQDSAEIPYGVFPSQFPDPSIPVISPRC